MMRREEQEREDASLDRRPKQLRRCDNALIKDRTAPLRTTEQWDLGRIESLSDGVFAVAMTLLLFVEPGIPRSIVDLGAQPTLNRLLELLPNVYGVATSFFVTAMFWIGHHRFFRVLTRADRVLVLLNFLMLFGIAVQPVTNNLLGGFPRTTVLLYAANLVFLSSVQFSLWAYALLGNRLTEPSISAKYRRSVLFRQAVPPIVFLLSIPVCLLNSTAAIATWLLPVAFIFLAVRDDLDDRTESI